MKLFGLQFGPRPHIVAPRDDVDEFVERRRPALICASCRLPRQEMVYLDNGRDYCRDCAVRCWEMMHFAPAGRRSSDLTLVQLLG